MKGCPCSACVAEGQGACGCLECAECGFMSLLPLEEDDLSGLHFCSSHIAARRTVVPEGALVASASGLVEIRRFGRWVPAKSSGKRRRRAA